MDIAFSIVEALEFMSWCFYYIVLASLFMLVFGFIKKLFKRVSQRKQEFIREKAIAEIIRVVPQAKETIEAYKKRKVIMPNLSSFLFGFCLGVASLYFLFLIIWS